MSALKKGDLIKRLPRYPGGGTRLFRLTLINQRVFSAESADQYWSGWGGPLDSLREGVTYERVEE